ncbi:alcohol dehydrogenase catalytic domain-containing protein, partial [Escherichia coli]|uniref:alcohol dehydrogenase catalytic domain-containing protein n=1 Tax=Escherichia coli TaxID=562 RepID=UPI000B2B43F6
MKTTALRLYGKRDLRLETFDLPEMQEDEILATVVTDSLCLSSWKEANLGENHKKVPDDVATNPIIIGHEFCGDILAVGKKWQHKFQPGQRYVIQANLQLPDRPDCPGYSFPWVGGEATHVVITTFLKMIVGVERANHAGKRFNQRAFKIGFAVVCQQAILFHNLIWDNHMCGFTAHPREGVAGAVRAIRQLQ